MANDSPTSPGPRSRQEHRCYVCNRTYERLDHLNRHLKSHDNERAYKCPECSKGFNRADLLNRHRASHETTEQGERSVRRRTEKACQACIRSKTKCEAERPCKRCKGRSIACVETEERQQQQDRRASIITSDTQHTSNEPSELTPLQDNTTLAELPANAAPSVGTPLLCENSGMADVSSVNADVDISSLAFDSIFPEFFEHIMMPFASGTGNHDQVAQPPNVSNYTQDFSFGVEDLDLSFLDNAAAWTPIPSHEPITAPQQATTRTPNSEAGPRSEAIKRSPWSWSSWMPPQGVGAFSEFRELNIREDRVNAADQHTSPSACRIAQCSLQQSNRDQMIRIVTQCTSNKLTIPSFPSLQLLEDLIDVFLLEDTYAIDSHVHIPSFDSRKARPELLLAMVARGAAFISLPPIWKMGLVLQDVVRYAIADAYERDNSTTRELQGVQVSLLWVNTGVWSGFRRSTEIAVSFLQPPVTMLAWSNAFSRSRYMEIVPTEQDSPEELKKKWSEWSEQESWKRLVFHTFLHDSQAMLVHMRAPLIAPAQLQLSVPASRELWLAPNAYAWGNAFIAQKTSNVGALPSMVDLIGDPELLATFEGRADKSLCRLIAAHAMAHEVFEYRQQAQMLRHAGERRRKARGLSHMGKLRDLYDDLTTFQTSCEADAATPPEIAFLLEFLMMSLHVELDDIQVFAGRAGEDEARRIYPSVRGWTQESESRRAMWHAGQVFHHAKSLEKTRLRDFYAVALYHATLTLWVWGMVTTGTSRQSGVQSPVSNGVLQQHPQSASLGMPKSRAKVILDGVETKATKAFIQLGHGTPGLQSSVRSKTEMLDVRSSSTSDAFCSLFDSRGVMSTSAEILRSNFPHTKGSLPPLVENLASLLDDLGKLPG